MAGGAADRSYDLHRAARAGGALVIFVDSRFWRQRQPDRSIEGSLVPGLLDQGHSVAVLRHRLVPAGRHPLAAEDVALGVAALLERVERGDFDRDRVFLAGHSSGAQLALLVALDPSWLRRLGKDPDALAGVISISGILDLAPSTARSPEEEEIYAAAFASAGDRRAASPLELSNPGLSSVLLLTAARDVPGYRGAASRLAERLRSAGSTRAEAFIANGRDHNSVLALADPRNDARRHVFDYLASAPREGRLPEAWQVVETWRAPPFTTADFHSRFPSLVVEYAADERFNRFANRLFRAGPGAPLRFRATRYQAIDLMRLLDALGPGAIGEGGWLEIRNVRGEWTRFEIESLRALRPQVVVGLDTTKNLFRSTDLYHTRRRYSWVDAEASRVDMARPLGAFLYFPAEEPGPEAGSAIFGRFGLTTDSFRRVRSDPLSPLDDLPVEVRTTLTQSHDCLACHRVRGVGGRALHIRAADGARMGGHALPLERYPEVVWKRFVFDQAAVANEVGADVVVFDPPAARSLYDFIVGERQRRGVEPWTRPERDAEALADRRSD